MGDPQHAQHRSCPRRGVSCASHRRSLRLDRYGVAPIGLPTGRLTLRRSPPPATTRIDPRQATRLYLPPEEHGDASRRARRRSSRARRSRTRCAERDSSTSPGRIGWPATSASTSGGSNEPDHRVHPSVPRRDGRNRRRRRPSRSRAPRGGALGRAARRGRRTAYPGRRRKASETGVRRSQRQGGRPPPRRSAAPTIRTEPCSSGPASKWSTWRR